MHKYVIMGAQGSGKGTQAKRLHDDFDFVHISVGDIFRWNVQAHTKLGARVKRIVSAGELVPDEVVEEIVQRRLSEHDWNHGFVLDGFPRNRPQAQFFLESYDINAVINLEIPDEVVFERVLARRKCAECGLDYNLIHHRPEVEDVCDVCGGPLVTRGDDTEESLRARLQDYHEKTEPVLDLFRGKELVYTIDGTMSADEVYADICGKLKLKAEATAEA
jgi:adenylate kinase